MSRQEAIDRLTRKLERRQQLNTEKGWQGACYTVTLTLLDVAALIALLRGLPFGPTESAQDARSEADACP